jgi:hypothetical protein
MGFAPVVAADVGSEVADPGLAGRATLIGAQVADGVIHIHAAASAGWARMPMSLERRTATRSVSPCRAKMSAIRLIVGLEADGITGGWPGQ